MNEGTGNFYFDNVCLLVTDDDYEAGNYPEYEDRPVNDNHNFPQYPLKSWNDNLNFWKIVLTPGYYEHSCIDYVEMDVDLWDIVDGDWLEHRIDSRFSWDKFEKQWYEIDRYSAEDSEKVISQKEVIDGVISYFDLEHQKLISEEAIKKAVEACEADGYYGLGGFVLSEDVLEGIVTTLRTKELAIVKERIQQIKKEYGYKNLAVSARFSNGETWYDVVDEAAEDKIIIVVDTISEDGTELTKENFNAQYSKHGIECVKVGKEEAYVKGTHSALIAFLGDFADMNEKDAKWYIKGYKASVNDLTEDTESDEKIWPKITRSGNRYKEDNLSGLPETFTIKYPAFEVEYFVRPGRQYKDHKTIFEEDSLAVLSIKSGEVDGVEAIFKKAAKDALKAYGQENLYFGSNALVELPAGITVCDNAEQVVESTSFNRSAAAKNRKTIEKLNESKEYEFMLPYASEEDSDIQWEAARRYNLRYVECDDCGGYIKLIGSKENLKKYCDAHGQDCSNITQVTIDEALHGGVEIDKFFSLAKQVGIETLGDLQDFLKNEKRPGESELEALVRYRKELGDDFKIAESKSKK